METYWIDSQWTDKLTQERLNNLVLLLMYTEGKCLSMHSRGSTFRSVLADGQTIFIKRDHYTMFKDVMAQLVHLEKPAAKSIREWHVLTRLTQLGFTVPQVIAAGFRTCLARPTVAGIVMLPIPGIALDDFLREDHPEAEKRAAIALALQELARLQKAGANWPDCKPEHFFLKPDGGIALLDLERVTFQRPPLSDKLKEKQRAFFRRKLPKDARALMD